ADPLGAPVVRRLDGSHLVGAQPDTHLGAHVVVDLGDAPDVPAGAALEVDHLADPAVVVLAVDEEALVLDPSHLCARGRPAAAVRVGEPVARADDSVDGSHCSLSSSACTRRRSSSSRRQSGSGILTPKLGVKSRAGGPIVYCGSGSSPLRRLSSSSAAAPRSSGPSVGPGAVIGACMPAHSGGSISRP